MKPETGIRARLAEQNDAERKAGSPVVDGCFTLFDLRARRSVV